jgi:hypothetical protein
MKSNPILIDLLSQLKLVVQAPEFSRDNLVAAMENLLLWLNQPEDNNDSNCKHIDYFISVEIMPEKNFEEIPENIRSILFDMGATLHDAHTSPKVATNFDSTPAQLLVRVQNL